MDKNCALYSKPMSKFKAIRLSNLLSASIQSYDWKRLASLQTLSSHSSKFTLKRLRWLLETRLDLMDPSLVVISHGKAYGLRPTFNQEQTDAIHAGWVKLQQEMAT